MRKAALALLLFVFLLGIPAWADNVISVGPVDPLLPGFTLDPSNVLAVAWFQPAAYTENISVTIQPDFFQDMALNAYLMDTLGTGVSTFNQELAASTVVAASTFGDPQQVALWTQAYVLPGWHYLVLAGTTAGLINGGWSTTMNTPVTGPGASWGDLSGGQFFATGPDVDTGYAPSSNFAVGDPGDNGYLMFNVQTPEPSTLLTIGCGLLALGLSLRRRRAARQ